MKSFFLVILVHLWTWTSVDHVDCSRGRSYDESCDLTASFAHFVLGTSEPTATCDTSRGLFCIPFVNRCGCYVPGAIFVNENCRARINHPCLGDAGIIDCVDNAGCTNQTFNYCKCFENYESNEEGTACVPLPTKADIPDHQSTENENSKKSVSENEGDSFNSYKHSYSINYSSRNTISVVPLILSSILYAVAM